MGTYGLHQVRKGTSCPDCGKRVQRFRSFAQQTSVHNVNERGPKSPEDIIRECEEDATLWKSKAERCAVCQKVWLKTWPAEATFTISAWRGPFQDATLLKSWSMTASPHQVRELSEYAAMRLVELEYATRDSWDLHIEIVRHDTDDVTHWQMWPRQGLGGGFQGREVLTW